VNNGKLLRLVTHIAASGLLAAGVAQAQTAPASAPAAAPAPAAASDSLTWKGITFYGIVDIGLQYQTHGVPASDYFPAGTEAIVNKNSNGSVTAVTPNNLSQSRLGLAGNEPIAGDWAGVFRLETFFNPQSGNLSDALKSLTHNNGKVLAEQTTNADSSVAGQYFAGAAYAGFSSPTVGSFTFGRHVTPLADGIAKYDPMGAAQAFSVIGWSGTAGGGGDTEDRRLDESIKYTAKYDWLHLGALYQISGSSGSTNTAWQVTIGAEFAGLSIDGYYAKKYDAIAAAALSNVQVANLVKGCNAAANPTPPATVNTKVNIPCYSVSNSLAATISDNDTYMFAALYNLGTVKLYGAYEHIKFANPNTPLLPGFVTIGGYVLAVTNNTNFDTEKTLEYWWAGVKWTATPQLELTASYLGINQNSFATGAAAGCSSATVSNKCSGSSSSGGLLVDYRLSKRFDWYLGTLYTTVSGGLANGFLQTNTLSTTTGIRFKF
jgi:predicted porin